MKSIVVVDIGNTSTSIALARDGKVARLWPLHGGLRNRSVIASVLDTLTRGKAVEGAVLCSVVPKSNRAWVAELTAHIGVKPLVVDSKTRLGVRISYPRPETIGPDRLANAAAVVARYGAPAIVADFGTAVTFDVVTPDCAYVGGVIAPGLPLMTDYLHEKTALLPHIRLQGEFGPVGRSTVEAMRIGAKIGYQGMVREITHYLQRVPGMRKATLCATGGFARWALDGFDMPYRTDPDLTLFGLLTLYELNRRNR